jgi:proteasome lid subunit RPN8/RPN11
MALKVSQAIYDEWIAHALADVPNEACGLLAGRDNEVVRSYRARNKAASPRLYEIDPADLITLFKRIDDDGLDHIGIYHSHTHTQAYPSATDIRLAFYPDAYYVIVSLMQPGPPHARAFRIRDGQVTEEPIAVE